jgi:hypothetical protein
LGKKILHSSQSKPELPLFMQRRALRQGSPFGQRRSHLRKGRCRRWEAVSIRDHYHSQKSYCSYRVVVIAEEPSSPLQRFNCFESIILLVPCQPSHVDIVVRSTKRATSAGLQARSSVTFTPSPRARSAPLWPLSQYDDAEDYELFRLESLSVATVRIDAWPLLFLYAPN